MPGVHINPVSDKTYRVLHTVFSKSSDYDKLFAGQGRKMTLTQLQETIYEK